MDLFDWWSITFLVYLLGIVFSLDAIWQGRTAQGTIAWGLALLLLPIVGIPLYLLFGTRKFHGYRLARRQGDARLNALGHNIRHQLQPYALPSEAVTQPLYNFFRLPLTHSNRCNLLIDGDATFAAMQQAIDSAQHSICMQFYIVRDDDTGRQMSQRLIDKAQQGVRVYFLYDEIGSHGLSRAFLRRLQQGGVQVSRFNSWKLRHRMQLNFRNHRKLMVVDGRHSFVGGINLGDEYLAWGSEGRWRDTHVDIEGPASLPFQLSFCEDWYWATQTIPDCPWQPYAFSDTHDDAVMCINTGPADPQESASLSLCHLINQAQHRIWIATPYFIPDIPTLAALKLAALRGLDVRVLIPQQTDKWFVQHAMQSYVEDLTQMGIRFYAYQPGFMHQKVLLIDNNWSCIGSANMDNRSLRINFEANALIRGNHFAGQTETMLRRDLNDARPLQPETSVPKRLLNKLLRLSSPLL